MSVPIKNNEYPIDIIDFTSEGFGVGKIDGFTIFVENTVVGDRVRVLLVKVKKTYGYGKLLAVLSPSISRVAEPCPHAKACGGCTLQHIGYDEQLRLKAKIVEDCIKRIGGFQNPLVRPTVGSKPFRYRNKAQFPLAVQNGKNICGFYAKRSHRIVPVADCLLQNEKNAEVIKAVLCFMEAHQIPAYDEQQHTGVVRHVVTRVAEKTNEMMVTLVINARALNHGGILVEQLRAIDGVSSVCVSVNMDKTNVIMGRDIQVLWGQGFITDWIGTLQFRISAQSFYQVNPQMTEWMYNEVIRLAAITHADQVVDCYCGIGTISLYAAKHAKKVLGIEVVESAVIDARANAALNQIENVEFMQGYAEMILPELAKKGFQANVVLLDPPRSGCDEKLLQALAQIKPERIVYVSCNPATLARDLKRLGELTQNRYTLELVQPFDMFCHTMGIESIGLLVDSTASETRSLSL